MSVPGVVEPLPVCPSVTSPVEFVGSVSEVSSDDDDEVDDDGKPQKLPWEDWREGEDALTSGWMRATSPAGDHRYEGTVHWAGELGYGVREPEQGQSVDGGRISAGSAEDEQ